MDVLPAQGTFFVFWLVLFVILEALEAKDVAACCGHRAFACLSLASADGAICLGLAQHALDSAQQPHERVATHQVYCRLHCLDCVNGLLRSRCYGASEVRPSTLPGYFRSMCTFVASGSDLCVDADAAAPTLLALSALHLAELCVC